MKDHPILFSGAMVRALLAGSKTQTRRVVKPQPGPEWAPVVGAYHPTVVRKSGEERPGAEIFGASDEQEGRKCPYGHPGDRLWVRESWKAHTTFDHLPPRDIPETHVWYLADDGYKAQSRTRASMHMPRWASRILLEIVSVRVERLQDISEGDCWAEGIEAVDGALDDLAIIHLAKRMGRSFEDAAPTYAALWESINGAGNWDSNPWVWVVEFKRVMP